VTSFFLVGYGGADGSHSVRRAIPVSRDVCDYSLIGSSFPFSPAAIVLSLSFLRRWQVKRPIRAGQRGRAHHSPRIPNSAEKERYLIERLFSERWECSLGRGETDRDRNIGRVRDRFERTIRCVIYAYGGRDCSLFLQTVFLNGKVESDFLNFLTPQILCNRKYDETNVLSSIPKQINLEIFNLCYKNKEI